MVKLNGGALITHVALNSVLQPSLVHRYFWVKNTEGFLFFSQARKFPEKKNLSENMRTSGALSSYQLPHQSYVRIATFFNRHDFLGSKLHTVNQPDQGKDPLIDVPTAIAPNHSACPSLGVCKSFLLDKMTFRSSDSPFAIYYFPIFSFLRGLLSLRFVESR